MGEIRRKVTLWGRGRKRVRALIDTGSSTSYLIESIAKQLYLPKGKPVIVYDDSGKVKGYKSYAGISLDKSGVAISIELIVVKKQSFPLLIGQDFLQRADVAVDFVHDKIQVAKKFRRKKYYR
jgi:hypothetical protein